MANSEQARLLDRMQQTAATAMDQHRRGDLAAAEQGYRLVLGAIPLAAQIRNNLAILLEQSGRRADARTMARSALLIDPAFGQSWGNFGQLVLDAKGTGIRALRCARILEPRSPTIVLNLAVGLDAAGRSEAARDMLEEFLRSGHADKSTVDVLAEILESSNTFDRALCARRLSVCCAPSDPMALSYLGDLLGIRGHVKPARETFDRANRIDSGTAFKFRLATATSSVPESVGDIDQDRRKLEAFLEEMETNGPREISTDSHRDLRATLFRYSYHDRCNRDLFSRMGRFLGAWSPSLSWTAPHCGAPGEARASNRPRRRIRVAIATAFLGHHSIGKLFGGVIGSLSRERFEVVAITRVHKPSEAHRRQMAGADGVVVLSNDLGEARRQIARLEADVLLWLDIGMDPLTYYLSFARLAPVQVVTVGHPDTTGVPAIDYFLTSGNAEPSDWADHFSEIPILLDEFPIKFHRPDPPTTRFDREAHGIPRTAPLYACPQTLFKLHPAHDHTFAEILERDRDARIVFINSALPAQTEAVMRRLSRAADDLLPGSSARIVFVDRLPQDAFLALVGDADLLLDPIAFSGGTSTYEAVATGTPSLAVAGKFLRSRISMAIYQDLGIDPVLATGADDYAATAAAVVHDGVRMRGAKDATAALSEILFDRRKPVTILEDFLVAAVVAADRGETLPAGRFSGERT